MDKAILKKFAIESRQDLMQKMENKIKLFYADEEFNKSQNGDIVLLSNNKHSLSLTKEEYNKRTTLISRIKDLSENGDLETGKKRVIEESAYTWFNRIVAIRYMEIHDYLPLTKDNQSLGIRVLSSKDNTIDPEILKITNLFNPDLDINFDKEYYSKLPNDINIRFKYVLLLVCKKLGKVIPQVFDGVTDYIDILIPDNLLNDTGFVNKIIKEVPEDNFNEVEIIGWLYQYYNQTEKDRVISAKKAYKKNEIPYATQLFTPDWIVKYMVENSLGRYYVEHNGDGGLYVSDDLYPSDNLFPSSPITENWKYFIKDNIKKENNRVSPTDIKCIDPCCGSGHILVYMFEVLYQIYENEGYKKAEIPELILKNNLYGLDIDDRAGQLSVLSVLLKAREYDKNIFNKDIVRNLNVMSIQESSNIDSIVKNVDLSEESKKLLDYLNSTFKDAKEIGSILIVKDKDYSKLQKEIEKENTIFSIELYNKIIPLIRQANILSGKYDIVDTNPPYMGEKYFSSNVKGYIKQNYFIAKSDIFASFIVACKNFSKTNKYIGMITPYAWMFLDSYKDLRKYLIDNLPISTLIQLEFNAFEVAALPVCTFVLKNSNENINGTYIKLSDFTGADNQPIKVLEALSNNDVYYYYHFKMKDFEKINDRPFAYWISDAYKKVFDKAKLLKEYAIPRQGMATTDNKRFMRHWYEVDVNNIKFDAYDRAVAKESGKKWFPYNKGGRYRKWYGNNDFIVDYQNDGQELINLVKEKYPNISDPEFVIKNRDYYFKSGITWTFISIDVGVRYFPNGFIFDVAGSSLFPKEDILYYILGFMCSKLMRQFLQMLNPTMNVQAGNIANLPIIINNNKKEEITYIAKECIEVSKEEWDSFETSWNFTKHPFIGKYNLIKNAFEKWNENCDERFEFLRKKEEELNKEFIEIYELEDDLSNIIKDKDVTIRKADKEREIKSFISYAVGCMFGRYSLDKDGLIFAGGNFDKIFEKYPGQALVDENGQPLPGNQGGWAGVSLADYKYIRYDDKDIKLSYSPDLDNIIPITEDKYFEDDIVTKFVKFVEVVYGKNTLEENLDFIANTLGKRTAETSRDTIRRYFLNDFYADHLKTYQKRPIYWLFDSGKKNGFKALIYMHRYNDQTVSKIRLDYLHKMQQTYATELKDVEYKLNNNPTLNEKKELTKKQADLNAKILETNEYDEKIAHIADQRISIDLDDGVAVNYGKFSVKNPKTGKEESILANSKDIVKKSKNSKEE